ncbi:MAG TPA: hypothetical protein VN397_02005 [Candidatus Methylomirabilis sp.]|nr:hypothetical protein [Candidatus Methylomirabilis sp.]
MGEPSTASGHATGIAPRQRTNARRAPKGSVSGSSIRFFGRIGPRGQFTQAARTGGADAYDRFESSNGSDGSLATVRFFVGTGSLMRVAGGS